MLHTSNVVCIVFETLRGVRSGGQGEPVARRRWNASVLAILGISLVTCSGCAYSYVDEQGATHAIGLMSVVVQPAARDGPIAGDIVGITAIGLAAGTNAQGGYLAVGYSQQTTAALRNDVVVRGNPVAALDGASAQH